MERYSAVTEYLFDWRTERDPSWEDIVFWRETGLKDDDDEVDARDGACSMETAMTERLLWSGRVSTGGSVSVVQECGSTRCGGVIGVVDKED
jgi:hypothetical protein